jgi:hypothetical protein
MLRWAPRPRSMELEGVGALTARVAAGRGALGVAVQTVGSSLGFAGQIV